MASGLPSFPGSLLDSSLICGPESKERLAQGLQDVTLWQLANRKPLSKGNIHLFTLFSVSVVVCVSVFVCLSLSFSLSLSLSLSLCLRRPTESWDSNYFKTKKQTPKYTSF
jgi:hypothetical protein